MNAALTKKKRGVNLQQVMPVVILAVLLLVLSLLNRDFLSPQTLMNLLQQVSAVGVVSIGAMFVIITGGIDFSAGYGLAMIGMAAGVVYTQSPFAGSVVAMVVTFIGAGALLGLVNGLLVAKVKIMPFIATLAMMSLTQGMSLMIGGGTMIMLSDSPILAAGQGKLGGVLPVSFLILLAVCMLAALLLHRTKLGVYTYAMGGNEDAARYAGIRVDRYKIMVYVVAGVCTGIASMLTVSRIAMVTPSIYGTTLTDAIAATCIGGSSMSGGRGTVSGTLVGAIIIVLISTALTYLKIPAEMQDVFKGAVILLAVAFDALMNRKKVRSVTA
ncbi:MAG: ABC transporter permease [Agathobaculum desmolans]|uniref:ABC transporter permease n=1 Tax=Agathobaculum desmolans TaxID=39484 RepID=UPI0039931498